MIEITQDAIDPAALLAEFSRGRLETGAVASFTGLTRDRTGKALVTRLTLQAYPGFTEIVMAEIETEARARFAVQDVLAVHRWGEIGVGEPIIFVAVAAAHRRAAFDAVDFLMDQFKTRAPFWKKEDGPDGSRWIEPRESDHIDLARWNADTL
ncbi:molybdenum cofactor biosynthesis protein MoaE [soil metagenome]